MSLRRLRYFVTVADEASFTAAARTLHMAQPPLSTQVRELEREFGVELFRREPRGITLTAAGQALLPEARRLLERYDLLGRMARRAGSGEVGRLAIGLIPSAANGPLPAALRDFGNALPDVEVSLVEGRPPELLRMLEVAQIDVALQYSVPVDARHTGAALWTESMVVALPPDHRLATRRRVPVSALAGEPFVLPARHGGDGLHEHVLRVLATGGVTPRVVQADIWLVQTIVGLVSSGTGVALVPESASVVRGGEVAYRPLSGRTEPLTVSAVWRDGDEPPTVHRFVELVRTGRGGRTSRTGSAPAPDGAQHAGSASP